MAGPGRENEHVIDRGFTVVQLKKGLEARHARPVNKNASHMVSSLMRQRSAVLRDLDGFCELGREE